MDKSPFTEYRTDIKQDFSYSFEETIPSEDFGAYYVGNINFSNDEIREFKFDLSWSELRITIDDKTFLEAQNSGGAKKYSFTKGIHKIEVEYINNWHTTNYNVNY